MHDADELSMAIVEAVAEREGVDVIELEPPLYEAIDTEALETLFATSTAGADASVTFTYCGYSIRVDGTGEIQLSTESADATSSTVRA